ncbi:protein PFC0760c-like [Lucilia sericata]|uniref:protein PFC0760c-like n=1 Tax=Lucilia sericata TaxID=13632 RepID=UPI0018A80C31|nr:protein PFC0760c-like [Lucilia sericata]
MLAINIIMNLAKIMLIFNGLNVSLNNVDATISPSSLAMSSSSSSSTTKDHKEEIMDEEQPNKLGQSVAVDVIDVLNIRHERSKQRRHSTLTEKEQQLHLPQPKQQLHLTRTLYENNPGNKELHLQHKVDEQKAVDGTNIDGDDDDNEHQQIPLMAETELNEFSQKFHSSISNEESAAGPNEHSKKLVADGHVDVNDIDVVNNVTEHLNNVNDAIVTKDSSSSSNSGTSNIHSLFEATAATHHLTPSAPFPTTTLKTVTHKIRKLHKKKIVESLRQLNIDKFNTNGGHLTKNHHRSLLEAEQLQQQAQWQDTNKISHKADESQQQQQEHLKQTTTVASIDANSRHQMAKEEEEEYNDEADMITNDIDTNESVNDSDLPDIMDKDDAGDGDDNDDDDKEDDNDNDDNLSDVFYQNDENVSNVNDDEDDNDDVDELYVTTHPTLLDDKFDKQFKNFSSEFIKDIDNNVDLEDNETENENLLTSWHEIKDLKFKPLNLSSNSLNNLLNNSTEDALNSTSTTEFPYDFPFSSEDHSFEPLLSASTSQGGIQFEHQQSQFYEKEEINFNDSFDLTQDDASASKDLIMDEAVMEDGDADSGHANGFPLSSLDESDSETDTETEGISDVAADDETNHFLEGVVDAANSEEIYDWDEISRSNRRDLMHGRDVVTKFLQIVETQHSLGSNCEAGTSLNLGEGVVDRYAQDRFRIEAEVAVNRANMLTR